MLVKLTNNAPGRMDDPIYINPDHVTVVYEDQTDGGTLQTMIYGGPTGMSWIVQESLSEVIEKLNQDK